ncbi:MAG: hypothetical protein NVSMB60_32620 [Mycobacterium sp.]
MPATTFRLITAAAVAASLAWAAPVPAATAAPPPPPPYIPGAPLPGPGSYLYPYNVIPVPAPATNDARGVRIGTNADPSQTAIGMPNDKLGNSPNKPNYLTSSSTRNGITAGIAPPAGGSPGINVVGGNVTTALEDPTGAPPKNATTPEAAAPTTLPAGPGNPAPLLEDPHGGIPPAPTG